jgi:hypothetical protein
MTTFAWDVPGYVQGHRFSDEPRYWDADTGRFRDRAGYDHLGNYVELSEGTPAFSTHGANNRRGLLLDNSVIFKFHPTIPWEGSMLFVVKPTRSVAATPTQYPWLFGCSTAEASNGSVRFSKTGTGTACTITAATPSSVLLLQHTDLVAGNISIVAFSFNQSDRIGRKTRDGVTITASAPEGGVNGNALAIGSVSSPLDLEDIGGVSHDYVRMGDMVGDGGLFPHATDYLHVFEQHFWKGDVLLDNSEKLADFIASLEEYYGI